MTHAKTDLFEENLRILAEFAKVMSHPARLAILKYLAETKSCISGDISNELPLSRTTVSQHLQELKKAKLIVGTIEGLKINYCLNPARIKALKDLIEHFLKDLNIDFENCC